MVPEEQMQKFRGRLLSWSEGNLREFPWRKDVRPYEVLVAEILLQQTLAVKVVPVYEEFFSRYPSPSGLAGVSHKEVAQLLEPLGFQNIRAEALVHNAEIINERGMPSTEESLADLRYVGDYAINATLCFGFGERRPIVDANVVRVYNRTFGLEFENAQESRAWEFAERVLPEDDYRRFNLALLDFGAMVCKSRIPKCETCFFTDVCEYYDGLRPGNNEMH